MASHAGEAPAGGAIRTSRSAWATGWTAAAGALMIFGGAMSIVEGIAALGKDTIFIVTPNYSYQWDLTSWGWTHLILGIVVLLAGCAVFTGAVWARAVGVLLAGFSMIINFIWLPHAPVWSVVLLAIDGFIIWGLCAPRRETQDLTHPACVCVRSGGSTYDDATVLTASCTSTHTRYDQSGRGYR